MVPGWPPVGVMIVALSADQIKGVYDMKFIVFHDVPLISFWVMKGAPVDRGCVPEFRSRVSILKHFRTKRLHV